ncbi:MAG: EAL domain-containing protein [Tepidisphaeraceae bacterium]
MSEAIKVLLVEDRIEDAELLLRELRQNGLGIVSRRVETAAELGDVLDSFAPDLILSDYALPGFGGMEALQIARQRRPDTPFILVSGTVGEERAVEALKQGADDYVMKDNRARLGPSVRRALKESEEREVRRRTQQELKDSEERFRSVMKFSCIGMALVASDGRWLEVNPALCGIVGYSEQELLATDFQSITHPDDLDADLGQVRRMLDREIETYQIEKRYFHKDGRIVWVLLSVSMVWRRTGEPQYFISQIQDITERLQQQEKIARLSRIQAVLSGINSTIVRVRDRRELFREACRIAVEQGGFKMAWIGLVEPGGGKAKPLVWEGFKEAYLDEVGHALVGVVEDQGTVGQALRDKKIVVANDIETDSHVVFKQEALVRGYRSLAVLPLVVGEDAVGVVVLYAAQTDFFDHEEVKLLKQLAADISFAVDYVAKEARLTYLSYYDTLTGLANRQLYFDRLAQAVHTANAAGHDLAILIIDLQRFKSINDTFGRSAGDQVLKDLAGRLQFVFSESSTPARIGGDRFAVTVAGLTGPTLARAIEDWLIRLTEPFVLDGVVLRTTVKMGVALYPGDGEAAETLFMNAEAALKRAKDVAERYLFYSPEMNERVAQHLHLESRLRKAVEQRQFVLHYQPKVDLATRRICGLEALIRWRDPEHGLVSPLEFIPVLEESGLIVDVGRWVIEQVVADTQLWRACQLDVPRVAVNVSQVQLQQKNFVATVITALGRAGGIDVEITETLIAHNTEANVQKLRELRKAGMQVFMDDFGTGYSSLSQIAELPLDALKIDRGFISGMTQSPQHMAIVSTIVNLAKALGIFVVAEGVETEDQVGRLKTLGCDEAQGYLFSGPLPAEDIAKLLAPAP